MISFPRPPKLSQLDIVAYALSAPKTPTELWEYVYILFNVRIPRTSVAPGHAAPFDAFCCAYFNWAPGCIWIGGRGSGKSMMLALLASVIALTKRVNVSVIGGSKDQSNRVLKYLRGEEANTANMIWRAPNAPRMLLDETNTSKGLIKTVGGLVEADMSDEDLEHNRENPSAGLEIEAHAASETGIRGAHPSYLLMDEVDLADYETIETARGTLSPIRGHKVQTVYSSTHHIYNGTMDKLIAEAKDKGWPVFRWGYQELMESNGGFMSESYIASQRETLGPTKFAVEYESKGPVSGVRIFDPAQLETMFNPTFGFAYGREHEWWHLHEEGGAVGKFYHGFDWAKKNHWSVFDTLQKVNKGFHRVAWYRTNSKPYPQIIQEAVDHVQSHRGSLAHDGTGVGIALDDLLIDKGLRRSQVLAVDWTKKKLIAEIATRYRHAIENGDIVGPMIQFAHSEHEYLTEEMLYGTDHCPDSVAAGMLALYAAHQKSAKSNRSPVLRVFV